MVPEVSKLSVHLIIFCCSKPGWISLNVKLLVSTSKMASLLLSNGKVACANFWIMPFLPFCWVLLGSVGCVHLGFVGCMVRMGLVGAFSDLLGIIWCAKWQRFFLLASSAALCLLLLDLCFFRGIFALSAKVLGGLSCVGLGMGLPVCMPLRYPLFVAMEKYG